MQMVSLDKMVISHNFYCLDVMNAILPLTLPSTSHDANTCTNGVDQESHVAPHFNHFYLTCNGAIDVAICIM